MIPEASTRPLLRKHDVTHRVLRLLRFGLVTLITCAALVGASPAFAGTNGIVTGAGSSEISGFAEVNARALQPLVPFTATPATGSFRDSGTSLGDLTGM